MLARHLSMIWVVWSERELHMVRQASSRIFHLGQYRVRGLRLTVSTWTKSWAVHAHWLGVFGWPSLPDSNHLPPGAVHGHCCGVLGWPVSTWPLSSTTWGSTWSLVRVLRLTRLFLTLITTWGSTCSLLRGLRLTRLFLTLIIYHLGLYMLTAQGS